VEDEAGCIVRIQADRESPCMDFQIKPDDAGRWFLAIFKGAGIEPQMSEAEAEDEAVLTAEEELWDRAFMHATNIASFVDVRTPHACLILAKEIYDLMESGELPKVGKVTSIRS
jgi:hypothetical protein